MILTNINLITSLLTIIGAALIGAVLAKRLKFPVILGYIAAGIIFGNLLPALLDKNFINEISDIGVTLLLFTLGIEFSFQRLKKVAGILIWAVMTQILLTVAIALVVLVFLGFSFQTSIFLSAAIAVSSTAIMVKILSEKGELETTPGELATGWSVLQDLAVVPMMVILPAISAASMGNSAISFGYLAQTLAISLLKSGVFLLAVIYLGRRGLPKILDWIAGFGNREILTITTVGIVFLGAASAYTLGLTTALGAFLVGLLVAETSENHAIFAEIRPLRDLFVVVFFVSLGLALPVADLFSRLPMLAFLTLTVVSVKLFIVNGLSRFLGYHRKSAFLVGLSLIPMSELGFVLVKAGVNTGAITARDYTFIVALIFATIFVGSPLISHGQRIYYFISKTLGVRWPKIFTDKVETAIEGSDPSLKNHIIICGYGRVGKYIGRAMTMNNIPFIVIDYNHATVRELRSEGIKVIYGDPADKNILAHAQVEFGKAIVIAIPDRHSQEMIIGNAHTLNRRIKIICRTHHEEDQKDLKALGVATIVQPEFEAAIAIVNRLLQDFGVTDEEISGKVTRLKIEHGLG